MRPLLSWIGLWGLLAAGASATDFNQVQNPTDFACPPSRGSDPPPPPPSWGPQSASKLDEVTFQFTEQPPRIWLRLLPLSPPACESRLYLSDRSRVRRWPVLTGYPLTFRPPPDGLLEISTIRDSVPVFHASAGQALFVALTSQNSSGLEGDYSKIAIFIPISKPQQVQASKPSPTQLRLSFLHGRILPEGGARVFQVVTEIWRKEKDQPDSAYERRGSIPVPGQDPASATDEPPAASGTFDDTVQDGKVYVYGLRSYLDLNHPQAPPVLPVVSGTPFTYSGLTTAEAPLPSP